MVVNTQYGRQRQRNQRILSYNNRENLKIDPFNILNNHLEIGWAWQEWIKDFEEETSYFEITQIKNKVKSFVKIYGGSEIKKLVQCLPYQAPVADDNKYRKLKRKLDNHLLPKKNKHLAWYTISKQQQPTSDKLRPKQNGEYVILTATVL